MVLVTTAALSVTTASAVAAYFINLHHQQQQQNHGTSSSSTSPHVYSLVLVGGGHAHVHVLKMLGMPEYRKLCMQYGIQVTLIASNVHTPYSGMLPGYIAGHYTYEEIHLDLNKLCRFANVRLVHAKAYKVDYNKVGGGGFVHVDDSRPPLRYDCLSIDVGSQPGASDQNVTPVKPIAHFAHFYQELVEKWKAIRRLQKMEEASMASSYASSYASSIDGEESTVVHETSPYRLVVVGGGAGGMELTLSLHNQLAKILPDRNSIYDVETEPLFHVILVTRGSEILSTYPDSVRSIFKKVLKERRIIVHTNATVVRVESISTDGGKKTVKRLVLQDDSRQDIVADDVLWCTTAQAPEWLSTNTPFACTKDPNTSGGSIRVKDTYECINHPGVFAAGDCCHMDAHPRPKAGVFAVRAGPYILENTIRYLTQHAPLLHHRPQKDFLTIITTGDKYAVASKGWWLCWQGEWVWKWKDYIDTQWMRKYTDLPDMQEMMQDMDMKRSAKAIIPKNKSQSVQEALMSDPMRCGGCGAKVGATTVSRVLKAVHKRQVERAEKNGWPSPPPIDHDDAAVIPLSQTTSVVHGGNNGTAGALIQTIDYFRSFIDDPYIFGKVAAVHALSDCHAMGATAQSALVLAVATFAADEEMTENTLLQLLCGVSDVLQEEQVKIVGGHTCEGVELACGLSVQGYIDDPSRLLRKRGGKPGDCIVLTKPLGTGALFAADMRAKCSGLHMVEALECMVQSNVTASRVAVQFGNNVVHACTDVTGFGLIGHLLEMLMANDKPIGAALSIRQMKFLQGGLEASRQGIYSSLQIQNLHSRRAVTNHAEAALEYPAEYPLLYDPQTAGGLLFFVDYDHCNAFVHALQKSDSSIDARVIGMVKRYPQDFEQSSDGGVCTIGSEGESTGQRIHIAI